jgi:predicted MFS family arabinose efflux permease
MSRIHAAWLSSIVPARGPARSLTIVGNYWEYLAVVVLARAADRSGTLMNQALAGRIFPREERVRVMAFMHAVRNVGMSLGAVLAGVAVQAGSATDCRLLVFGNGVSYLPVAIIISKLGRYERIVPRPPARPIPAGSASA